MLLPYSLSFMKLSYRTFFVAFTFLFCGTAVQSPAVFAQLPAPAYGEHDSAAVIAVETETTPPKPAPRAPKKEETPGKSTSEDKVEAPRPRTLAPLSIGGTPIRGLGDFEVVKKIRAAHEEKLQSEITLWDGKKARRLSRVQLGASIPYYQLLADARALSSEGGDVPIRFEVDLKKAKEAMSTLGKLINQKPSTASLDVDASGKVIFSGGEGATLAVEGSALRVKAALEHQPPQIYAELVVAYQGGSHSLSQFKYLLAEYSTPYDAGLRGRTKNLVMSAKLVNGTIVEPGKVFSTNHAIGPRNAEAGWQEAKMFVSGQVVDGVGAGICQTSTTIYNAALLANFPIVERHQHSFRVFYAPASRDAAIYWGHKDMRFRNNTSGPIYVQTFTKNQRFHTRLYGTQPLTQKAKVESKVLSQKGDTRSEAYRIIETPSGSKRELLSRDHYKKQP